jgi:hypothetical protein
MDESGKLKHLVILVVTAFLLPSTAFAQRRDTDRRNRPDRYWAMFRDGSVIIGKDLQNWSTGRSPSLNGRPLFDPNNPLRLIRDTTIQSQLSGPYIEFANGDILPGRLVGGLPADPYTRMPAHLLVSLNSPLVPFDRRSSEIAIDPEHVARIVIGKEARGPLEPGTLLFTDGRKVKVKAVKWALGGVKALTAEGSVTAGWLELSEIHVPNVNPIAALLDDALAPTPRKVEGVDALLGRIATTNGAVLTYRRAMLRIDGERDERGNLLHTIQPSWALQAFRVPFDEVVTRGYREPADIPLSSLPAQTLVQKNATGFTWPWRRNANVRGTDLVLGSAIGDVGVGTHSYSEIAFDMPPAAKLFTATVGINRGVGNGGCAKVLLYKDKVEGKPLWESGFLRGGDSPLKVGSINVAGAKKLVLVTDYAHDGRPRGADPLDIRDEVDWLWPSVTIDLAAAGRNRAQPELDEVFPQLADWTIGDDLRKRASFRPFWLARKGRWTPSLFVDSLDKFELLKPFEFSRKIAVTQGTAWLPVTLTRDDLGQSTHEMSLWVEGRQVPVITGGDVNTGNKPPGEYEEKYFSLGEFAGKTITATLRISPRGSPGQKPSGIVLGDMAPLPIVTDLPESGATLKPQVSITSLKPVAANYKRENKQEIAAGKTIDGRPLTLIGWPYADGYGMPPGESALTYALDPAWTTFVAVIGVNGNGWWGVGPYEVLLDDQVAWRSADPEQLGRTNEARQIEVHIPAGHKTITLRVDKKSQAGASWADAGFVVRK